MPPLDNPDTSIRQAVLLVGGRGTRMWPLTAETPKGLLPLAGVPFVEYQLRQLARLGVAEVFLAMGRWHREQWDAYSTTSPAGIEVHLAIEDEPLDTAGPVRAILDRLDPRFLVLNGDVVIEANLAALIAATAPATLGLIEVADTSPYGVVVADPSGLVERFIEKPPTHSAPARTVNAGMYSLTREVLAGYPLGPLSFERVVFPDLAASRRLAAVLVQGHWLDIGTPTLYLAAHDAVYAGASLLHRPPTSHTAGGAAGVGTGAWSWIGPGAEVAADATVAEAVVMSGARIESGAVVRRAVVGQRAVIGAGATVTGAAVVGPGARIGAGCELDHGVRIGPGAELDAGTVTFSPPG